MSEPINEAAKIVNLSHYVASFGKDEIEAMTKEELIEVCLSVNGENWRISAAYSNNLALLKREVEKSQELRVELSEWRTAARRLFSAAVKSVEWIATVRTNLQHVEGFTHHMKDVVNQLNVNVLESAEGDLMQPIEKIREMLKKNGDDFDIPF